MIRFLLSISVALLIFACGSSENIEKQEEPAELKNIETTAAYPIKEESLTSETSQAGFLGSWTVDAATAGARMDVTFNEDGSYSQTVAGQESSGTWKKMDETHLEMMNPNLKKPQTWEIKGMTENTLDICWNPSSAKPLTIPFKKVE